MSTLKVDALQDTSGNGFYPARAWCYFNGTGTVAINADGNISSITDNSTGNYTFNFSTSFSSVNYSIGTCGGRANNDANYFAGEWIGSRTSSAVRTEGRDHGNNKQDPVNGSMDATA